MLKSKPSLGLLLLVALYAVAHLTWYLDTPLGQSPALDGQENLILAERIAQGELAAEPFYRAMLYPFVLAYLPLHWAVLGLLLHLANTFLTYKLAQLVWKNETGALLSGALVGLNPVLLHFAFDPLDVTMATSFFLLALVFIPEALSPSRFADRWLCAALVGFFLGMAAVTRPHFFAVLAVAAPIALYAGVARKNVEWQRSALFISSAALPVLLYGLVNLSVGGQFRVLPWQGAYNLWASNGPNANGLYLQQSVAFHYLDTHQNPTRLESETLYRREFGELGTIDERSRYWRGRTVEHILENPLRWVGLMAKKSYALLNNYEQYNNKTYHFHKARSPWLRYNPIGWGLILVLAAATTATLWRQSKRDLGPFLVIAAAFAAGILLYMASGRFRAPLVPLLAALAGGLPYAIKALKVSSTKIRRNAIVATVLSAALAFVTLGAIKDKATVRQDQLLLANAAAELGRDKEAIDWADAILAQDPDQQAALRLRSISRYNLAAAGEIAPDDAFWRSLSDDLAKVALEDETLSFVKGVAAWNLGDREQAHTLWQEGYQRYNLKASSCLAALHLKFPERVGLALTEELLSILQSGRFPLLKFALAQSMNPTPRTRFLEDVRFSHQAYQTVEQSLQRVLPR